MGIFTNKKKPEIREDTISEQSISDPLLRALLQKDSVDRETALNIPAISACVNMIADTVSALKVKLYRRSGDKIEEILDDRRTFLLNEDTGDTLDAVQFKKAMVMDMFLGRGGYAYVNRRAGTVLSIHYVENEKIGFHRNSDPIFKDYQMEVGGLSYEPWQFITLLRNTRNGCYGKSIIEESPELLEIIYGSQQFEKNLVKTGGNKKGFLQAKSRVEKSVIEAIKNAFRHLYSNNTDNVIVLNDGLEFKESSNTSVEMQMNENKETNSKDVCKVFLIPPSIINGNSSEEDKKQYYQGCIMPILVRFATAINRAMLTEDEKRSMFFAFDDTDLTKGDIEKRFAAYKTALDAGFMQVDEVRRNEKLQAFGLDFIKLGLQDVIYFPEEHKIYTPNTNKMSEMGAAAGVAPVQPLEGGEESEN
jgi:HK97 family phage portal protein